jgi:hypothetical protein
VALPEPLMRPRPKVLVVDVEGSMKATQQLHQAGQSIWLDHITRALLASGTLARYVRELSVAGLTSNPTIFVKSWEELLACIGKKSATIRKAG